MLARTAWIADDAYISLRVVDNFVNGYGLRWNVDERVQAYTSPLWVFVLSGAYYVTREAYFTTLLVSFVVSLAAVLLVALRTAPSKTGAVLALGILVMSRAFIDYSTSGLENPLTHFLLAVFAYLLLKSKSNSPRLLLQLTLLTSLAMVNRMDTVLLMAPALLAVTWRLPINSSVKAIALGSLPIVVWMAFSTIYYGFPFPNTAYAKLGGGIPLGERLAQGVTYMIDSLTVDPITLLVIAWSVSLAVKSRSVRSIALAAGALLYLGYSVRVGGDFMSGRFLSAPLFVGAILVARSPIVRQGPTAAIALVLIVAVGWAGRTPTLLSGVEAANYETPPGPETGIADERRYYFARTGLLFFQRSQDAPAVASRHRQRRKCGVTGHVRAAAAIGFDGFFSGPEMHIVDKLGLSDPLLARIPARFDPAWRIGHLMRELPEGYLDSITSGENNLSDEALGEYYSHLQLITAGELFTLERWQVIWSMNLGHYEHLIDRDKYRFSGMNDILGRQVSKCMSGELQLGVPKVGLRLPLDRLHHEPILRLMMGSHAKFRILFVNQGEVIGQEDLYLINRIKPISKGTVWIPQEAQERGYDELRVFRLPSGKHYVIESFQFAE